MYWQGRPKHRFYVSLSAYIVAQEHYQGTGVNQTSNEQQQGSQPVGISVTVQLPFLKPLHINF
jgi:hypothetical protein